MKRIILSGLIHEEAIKKLKDILEEVTETDDSVCYVTSDDTDTLKAAIKALEIQPCEDCISREEALKAMCDKCPMYNCVTGCSSYRHIEKMPSVTPTRPKGEWIPMQVSSGRDSWKCSICGRRARGKLINLPFCHCGADMRESEEE